MTDKISCVQKQIDDFLNISDQFKLGKLTTESQHPKTHNLSSLVKRDCEKAWKLLCEVDDDALETLKNYAGEIEKLCFNIGETFRSGKSVFLCGCGATGRLSIALETINRFEQHPYKENIIGFMAGGDMALIKSIENFEDYTDYGAKQLLELGFTEGDLLLGITEGGETPFVIGATNKASEISTNNPFFLYCNPNDELIEVAQRSSEVIFNQSINKLLLTVGPMALSGSTRMQASTVQMLVVGFALKNYEAKNIKSSFVDYVETLQKAISSLNLKQLTKLTAVESKSYQNAEHILYQAQENLAISILTDTTERSPTFNLSPFENQKSNDDEKSWCYLWFKEALNTEDAWLKLLQRKPRTLEWEETKDKTSLENLLTYNFSKELRLRRNIDHILKVSTEETRLKIDFNNQTIFTFNLDGLDFLQTHLLLKMILNSHSTLTMGLLGRYEGNLMTFVKPSNNKLIDRAIRYAILLLANEKIKAPYNELVEICFKIMHSIDAKKSFVLEICHEFQKRVKAKSP